MNLPDTFTDKMKNLLGNDYKAYEDSFLQKSYNGLRFNRLKVEPSEYKTVTDFTLDPIPWTQNGYYYMAEESPSKHPYYYAGLYYLQEPSAMTPASFLPIEPGDKVLDLCAAPGGKTTELGAKLQGQGVLVTNDISFTRSKALLKNVERFGITNAIVTSEAPAKLTSRFTDYFDKILVDAPCSGEGMFRKDSSMIKNWEEVGVSYYASLQRDIIIEASLMLKPGGLLLYSTCTFSPEENEETIEYLLSNNVDMELVDLPDHVEGFDNGHPEWTISQSEEFTKCKRLWPHKIKGEGHFLAMLRKREDAKGSAPAPYPYRSTKLPVEADQFLNQIDMEIDSNRLEIIEDTIYYLPEGLANIKGLRILRSGLNLGKMKKNRFEPSQALAMALRKDQYPNSITLKGDHVIKYLKCETIPLEGKNGYVLLCLNDYPLGWGKLVGGNLKNKYQPGWRMM